MANLTGNFLAAAFYFIAAILIALHWFHGKIPAAGARIGVLGLTLGALVLHAGVLYPHLHDENGLNLAVSIMFSLVAWIVVALYVLASLKRPVDNIGVLVMPIAGLTLILESQSSAQHIMPLLSSWQAVHIVVSLLAYSLLCLAAAQSVLLLLQERGLKQKHPNSFIRALPPMETTETLMFQMILLGFALLTLTVASGMLFSETFFGKPFQLKHHTVLALCGWVVYLVLLVGRWRLGWRGRVAIRWTLGGFLLLVLAYFGSKFVLEVLLHRA